MDRVNSEQLQLQMDWGREPWNGFRPRSLTRGWRLWKTLLRDADFRSKLPESARTDASGDPAQLTLFLKGKSDGS